MPNIRGFAAIMALLFAPNAEFQVDKDNNQYIGAICGLGFDPKTKKGFDPGSDAQVIY
jgi:ATP-dependent RNA helicase TDRD9